MTVHPTPPSDPVLRRCARPALVTAHVPRIPADGTSEERLDALMTTLARDVELATDDKTAARVTEAVRSALRPDGLALVAVADADEVLLWPTVQDTPHPHVRPGPLPSLAPLIAWRQTWVPHALVVIDRAGADITLVTSRADDGVQMVVDGERTHLTKSNPGGWSQRRFQQHAEETWEDNARAVAARLDGAVAGTDIDVLLVSGDVRAVGLLHDNLPTQRFAIIEVLDGGSRAEDGSTEALHDAATAAVRRIAAARRGDAHRAVMAAVARGSGAQGRVEVLDALLQHRVETLVLHLDDAHDRVAHIGEEPTQVAADAATLHALGLQARRAPLPDVALSAAAATGAGVIVLQEALTEVEDGIAASVRQ